MRDPIATLTNTFWRWSWSRLRAGARLRFALAPLERADHLRHRPVEDHMASSICMQLLFLESENPKKEISMYINSPGGW